MPVMDSKFSSFINGGDLQTDDIVVGLRDGLNTRFTYTSGSVSPGLINEIAYYATTGSTLTGLTTANNGVLVTSSGGVPSISTTLPSGLTIPGYQTTITFPLALTLGGSNANLTASNGGIVYSTATAMAILAGTATASQILLSGATAAPTWSTATYPATAGTAGNLLTSDGTNWLSSPAAGAGSPLTTKGDIYAYSTTNGRFPVAVGDGKILQVSSGATFGIAYSTATYPVTAGSSGNVLVSDGTNWSSSATTSITALGAQAQALNMNSHLINNVVDPVSAQDAATKNYVDQTALNGTSVYAASAATLGTVTQSGAGAGATLTNAGAQATFALDGVNPPVGVNVLIKNTATGMAAENEGIYTVVDAGSGASNWVLRRATSYDTATEINNTGLIAIQNGSTLAGTAWYNTSTIVTVDTTAFNYAQFGTGGSVTSIAAGTGIVATPDPITTTGTIALNVAAMPTFAMVNGGAIRTATGAGNTLLFQAYDVNAASYTTFGQLTANNDPTFDLYPTDIFVKTGGSFGTGTTAADTAYLKAYDVDGAAYVIFATLTAGNTPKFDLAAATTMAGGNAIFNAATGTLNSVSAVQRGGVSAFTIDTSGRLLYPNQPAFVLNTSVLTDVTGDGTDYATVFTGESLDRNNNCASGVFTAPVTGLYLINASIVLTGLTALHTSGSIFFLIAGSNYFLFQGNIGAIQAGGTYSLSQTLLVPMNATQTCALHVQVSGSTKTVDITSNSIWGGFLQG